MKLTTILTAVFLTLTNYTCIAQALEEQSAAKAKNVAIMPATLYFTAAQGETQTLNITIDNSLDSPVQFALSVVDFNRNENGEAVEDTSNDIEHSCAEWLKLENNIIKIKGNTTEQLPVTIRVPDNEAAVSEMKWAMIYMKGMTETVTNQKSGNINASIDRSYQVGIQVYQTPPNVVNKELRMLSFKPKAQRREYRVECINEGGVLLRCNAYIELISSATGEKYTIDPTMEKKNVFKILPGQKRNIDFEIDRTIPDGTYTAIAFIDANDPEVPIEAAQLEIDVR